MQNITSLNVAILDIVSKDQYMIIEVIGAAAWIMFSVVGMISNTINIIIFIAMGRIDGVTVSFLALSCFDLIYEIAAFCLGMSAAFTVYERLTVNIFPADPFGTSIIIGSIMVLITVTNVLATTFIAVVRCLCVVKPLHFKNYFTVKRTVYFMTGFAIFAVAIYTPILANMGMVTRLDNKTKISRPTLWWPPSREPIKNFILLIIDMILPVSTEVIILVCIILMANSLRAATRFRQTSQIQTCDKHKPGNASQSNEKSSSTYKLSDKELRVVAQVTLISVVYIICNTPRILMSIAGFTEPEFRIGKRYTYFYLTMSGGRKYLELFNATVNTFIYYRYNNKFKTTLISKFMGIKLVSEQLH